MKSRLIKILKRLALVLAALYVLACVLLYFFQEKMLFHPKAISKDVVYSYSKPFEEAFYEVETGVKLNTLLFLSDSTKMEARKLIFFIHGNGGNLKTLGAAAEKYTDRGYDCFLYDYRGYGKSDGSIDSEKQLFSDAQILYDQLKKRYPEKDIVIVGYSLGSGIAAWLASKNQPAQLILEAPYFSMIDMMRKKYPIFPTFLLRYPLESYRHLAKTNAPIHIFHGDKDAAIPYVSSLQLKQKLPRIHLTTLKGVDHNTIFDNKLYQSTLTKILGADSKN